MKKIISLLFIVTALQISTISFAGEITTGQAAAVARSFYYERVNQDKEVAWKDIKASLACIEPSVGTPLYYIFTINKGGFVIVSATDAVVPVLGYSFDGMVDVEHLPVNFSAWMGHYKDEIKDVMQRKAPVSAGVLNDWSRLLADDPLGLKPCKGVKAVAPMLSAMWNQSQYYNDSCPADPASPGGYNGHVPTGCVATAMGMIMYHYRWPHTGTGSYSYTHATYGQISGNFGNTTYYWDQMSNSLTSSSPTTAQLLFHEGVSVDMDYGPQGSGMWNHKAAYSMRTYFKYHPQTQYLFKDSTTINWDSTILAHLDRKMILYYAGWAAVGSTSGHAFVCDGYQTTQYFHFNWGWGSYLNGYFYLNALNPGGSNFNFAQELILNIYPDTLNYTYPEYCTGQTITHNLQGTIEDGSGPVKSYLPNSSCSWLIDPQVNPEDSISSILISFSRFETVQSQDVLTIYDGPTTASPILGSYSGNSIPPNLISSSNKVLITFSTGAAANKAGWLLAYQSNLPHYCGGSTTLSDPTGTVTDGSGAKNYLNNSSCAWIISPPFATGVTLTFTQFDTEQGKDSLCVYDLDLGTLYGHYSGNQLPPVLNAGPGGFYLVFRTNGSVTHQGWSANYSVKNLGIDSPDAGMSINIFPNPTQDLSHIQIQSEVSTRLRLSLTDAPGRIILQKYITVIPGSNQEDLDLSNLSKGMYILRIGNEQFVGTRQVLKM